MQDTLRAEHCVACVPTSPRVTAEEIRELSPQIPDWQLLEVNGENRLERSFKFPDFKQALDFTNRVGQAAEREDHHPLLVTEWGKVTVDWWTHKIHGLHRNDFIMAAKTDEAYGEMTGEGLSTGNELKEQPLDVAKK